MLYEVITVIIDFKTVGRSNEWKQNVVITSYSIHYTKLYEYLSELSAKIFEGMKSADPEAVWVMQGWLFYSHRDFWKAPQIEGLLDAVPNERMIILDLAAEIEPVWKRTEAFYGKEWIWCMLHNFGGNISLFGRIENVAEHPAA